MNVRYAHDIILSSSLATYKRDYLNIKPLQSVPISIDLRFYKTDRNETVTEDSKAYVCSSNFHGDKKSNQIEKIYLYDSLGYIIGQTRCHDATENYVPRTFPMYRYNDTKHLKLGDIFQHIPAPLGNAVFRIEAISRNKFGDSQSLDMGEQECTAPTVIFKLTIAPESSVKIQSNDLNKDINGPVAKRSRATEKKKPDNHNIVEINKYSVQSLIDKSEYFRKYIPKTPNADGKVTVRVSDVDPELFRRFVDFVHYGKSVYLMTEDGLTLQQCCREMLQIADGFLCPELARDCAECIVKVTSKDTVFADIRFLATHYNGTAKMEIISRMARKVKELKPDNQVQQLDVLCQQWPNVAAFLLYKTINW